MHRRAVRLGVVALLVIGGIGAAAGARELHRRLDGIRAGTQDVAATLDTLRIAVADLAVAQAAYVAPGQLQQASAQVVSLTQQITSDEGALRPKLRSDAGRASLDAFAASLAAFRVTDQRIHDRLRDEDPNVAIDVIYGESRRLLGGMRAALDDTARAEAAAFGVQRTALTQQIWIVLGALAVAWLLGLLILARVPAVVNQRVEDAEASQVADTASAVAEGESAPSSVDLGAAADLCTAIARITSTAALPDVLARAASVLDASGIIVWMGAGDELFAASAYGYDPKVISRLGPIHRSADNATAAAWRAGETRTVSGDMVSNGAVVAPMWGPDSCIGVFAAEIRHGREADGLTRSVAAMIAAQLASVVSAWPGTGDHTAAATAPRVSSSR